MNDSYILAVDIGTSSIKMGIFNKRDMKMVARSRVSYLYDYYSENKGIQIVPDVLWNGFLKSLRNLNKWLEKVKRIGLSVLCPGLIPLNRDGEPLYPAIIHLDRRSAKQAREALRIIGEKRFLAKTGNLPFPGGISLTSILWIRENLPSTYEKTFKFGHINTFFARRLTGKWGIDPTNASFTGLYDTISYSDWDFEIMNDLNIREDKLPPVVNSDCVIGKITKEMAMLTNLQSGIPVVMGAGDTACAALGASVIKDGQILNSTGTVEVMTLCMDKPISDKNYLLRTHAVPERWLLMKIISAGGAAIEWFYREFCQDMSKSRYYDTYLPDVLCRSGRRHVKFSPYLAGDRTSMTQKSASFTGLNLKSTRDDCLHGLIDGIIAPLRKAVIDFGRITALDNRIYYTGGGAKEALTEYKKRNFSDFDFVVAKDAALRGAALLAKEAKI